LQYITEQLAMSRDMSRDKSHSARDIDVRDPATIDVSDDDAPAGKLEKTPSHSLPAVALGGGGGAAEAEAAGEAAQSAFVDVDDIAMHVDRDPFRWHDTVRVCVLYT